MINKNIFFSEIKKLFFDNSITFKTSLEEDTIFIKIDSLNDSKKDDLTFFHNKKYLNQLIKTQAKACLIQEKYLSYLNPKCIPIILDDPYLAYALISNLISPLKQSNGHIDKSLIIEKTSKLGKNIQINSNVIIKENCNINNNVIIYENTVIGPNVIIGESSRIMSNCIIKNAIIGKNCNIQPGVVIGGKGFGFTPKQKIEIRHTGDVKIGNNVDIGSNTTIDRGTLNSTHIDDNCRIDNLVQIAHNVKIGKNTIIAAQTGISGSTEFGNNCIIGGQVGVSGHLKIGNNVKVAAKSGVTKNFDDDSIIGGYPAREISKWRRSIAKQYKGIK